LEILEGMFECPTTSLTGWLEQCLELTAKNKASAPWRDGGDASAPRSRRRNLTTFGGDPCARTGHPPPCRRTLKQWRCASSTLSDQSPPYHYPLKRRRQRTRTERPTTRSARRHRRSTKPALLCSPLPQRRRRTCGPRSTPRYCLLAWCAALRGRPRARVLNSSPRVGAPEAPSDGSRTPSSRRPNCGEHGAATQAR
jgi:hypothetical protein